MIDDLKADKQKCENYIEGSLAMCTSLVPLIGYDKAAAIAYDAFKTGKTIREIVLEKNIIDKETVDKVLDPYSMINPK